VESTDSLPILFISQFQSTCSIFVPEPASSLKTKFLVPSRTFEARRPQALVAFPLLNCLQKTGEFSKCFSHQIDSSFPLYNSFPFIPFYYLAAAVLSAVMTSILCHPVGFALSTGTRSPL